MGYKAAGRYVRIDQQHPQALGVCDVSGFIYNKRDLQRQMEWRGDALAWTGFYRGPDFIDIPNEQGRSPRIPPDPVPLHDTRTIQSQIQSFSNNTWPPFSEMEMPFSTIAGAQTAALPNSTDTFISGEYGNLAMTGQQRLSALQNFNWSGS